MLAFTLAQIALLVSPIATSRQQPPAKPRVELAVKNSISAILPQAGRTAIGTAIALKISRSGLKKGSLSRDGAIAAFAVASLAFSASFRSGVTLLTFYLTGSKLTKVGANVKAKLEEGYVESGNRGAPQVIACSLIGVVCALLRRALVGADALIDLTDLACLGNRLTCAYVAFFACCAGDTWASELGVLSKSPPRLVTMPWKVAPPGTNGGVSALGTLASAAGGACMGLSHAFFLFPPSMGEILALTSVGLAAGLLGSMLDSFLGATVQATYYDTERKLVVKKPSRTTEHRGGVAILSNEAVNFVSTAAIALAAAMWPQVLLGWLA